MKAAGKRSVDHRCTAYTIYLHLCCFVFYHHIVSMGRSQVRTGTTRLRIKRVKTTFIFSTCFMTVSHWYTDCRVIIFTVDIRIVTKSIDSKVFF
jgi:hypothetical protein